MADRPASLALARMSTGAAAGPSRARRSTSSSSACWASATAERARPTTWRRHARLSSWSCSFLAAVSAGGMTLPLYSPMPSPMLPIGPSDGVTAACSSTGRCEYTMLGPAWGARSTKCRIWGAADAESAGSGKHEAGGRRGRCTLDALRCESSASVSARTENSEVASECWESRRVTPSSSGRWSHSGRALWTSAPRRGRDDGNEGERGTPARVVAQGKHTPWSSGGGRTSRERRRSWTESLSRWRSRAGRRGSASPPRDASDCRNCATACSRRIQRSWTT